MDTIPVVVVEPNEILREGLRRILNKSQLRVAVDCAAVGELWGLSSANSDIRMILIDVAEQPALTVADMERMRQNFAKAKIVLMTDPAQCRQAMEVGRRADGLVLRTYGTSVLIKALELILLGERIFPVVAWQPSPSENQSPSFEMRPESPRSTGEQQRPEALAHLSERELDVMRLLRTGDPNKVIARRLGISEATVKVHVKAILRKTHAKNRTEAALLVSNLDLAVASAAGREGAPARNSTASELLRVRGTG